MPESIEYDSEEQGEASKYENNADVTSCYKIYTDRYREYDNQGSQIWLHEYE